MESKISALQQDIDVPKDLECSICGDLFDKAVSLKACGHTYCSVCIRNHWVTTSRPGVHRQPNKECPLCRAHVGHDVNKALLVNREIQEAVKAFRPASLSQPPSTKFGCTTNESPIQKRIQSRNYAAMQRKGKKELQRICKEYNLATSGNEQELVDRLRYFECVWNAELDTIDTPMTPSELVAKFKDKERKVREERSREVMFGKVNDAKYMKRLTSSLLDDENKRNDKIVSATSSGNATFDAKFQSKFSELIADGRRRMKEESYWSSSPQNSGARTYADDCIHDKPHESTSPNADTNASGDDRGKKTFLKGQHDYESAKPKSSIGDQSLKKKKTIDVFNPYNSAEKKQKLQNTFIPTTQNLFPSSCTTGSNVPKQPKTTSQRRPSPSLKTIVNPYAKKPATSFTLNNITTKSGKFQYLPQHYNLKNARNGESELQGRIPFGRATNLSFNTTNTNHNKLDDTKNPRPGPPGAGSRSNGNTPARKKNIRNPYI